MLSAPEWIEALQLRPHPEGGYFRQTYRSSETIAHAHLPARFSGDRSFSTAIYYLLEGKAFSAFHRIRQDEVWHFYMGSTLLLYILDSAGTMSTIRLGQNVRQGEVLQAIVPAGELFGARLADSNTYALVGCTVAPGFDFADFEMPSRRDLLLNNPQHTEVIESLTRE